MNIGAATLTSEWWTDDWNDWGYDDHSWSEWTENEWSDHVYSDYAWDYDDSWDYG